MILNIVRRAYSPPGTGGVAAQLIKRREATEAAQTGWSDRRAHVFAELTTPAAPSKVASRHFLDGASTPPVPGGEYPRLTIFANPRKILSKRTSFAAFVSLCLRSSARVAPKSP